MALGVVQIQLAESLDAGRASIARALALDSMNAEAMHVLGWLLFYEGRTAEAVAAFHRTLALEPGRPVTIATLGYFATLDHRWADAERLADSAIAMDRAFIQAYRNRATSRFERGDTGGMRADYAVLRALTGDASFDSLAGALLAVVAGDSTLLRTLLARDRERLATSDAGDDQAILRLAGGLTILGEGEQALDWLERTRWKNTNFYANLQLPPYDRMRGMPRYERLLDEWRVPAGIRR
jgi:tetratricopeptide (TPR) repeat protein